MSESYELCSDWQMIGHYCGGDNQAFEALYGRHQAKLQLAVRGLLRRYGLAAHLADEVAQDTWLSLLDDQAKRLQHYDPSRGSFQRYLQAVAEQLVQQRGRTLARRGRREVSRLEPDPEDRHGLTVIEQAELDEFMEDLSRQERHCLREQMGEPQDPGEPPLSAGNARLLKHRLRLKWPKYFG
jgi:DNA-directed RNA polymerase specialized sigma24 family protein